VAARQFREDLYYRLSVFPVRIPPLRERRDDIPELARHFTLQFGVKLRRGAQDLTPAALRRLQTYDWPGNVRELQNVIERAVVLSRGITLDVEAIAIDPESHRTVPLSNPAVVPFAEAERRAILAALHASAGRISGSGGAADLLALKPTTLHAKMKKLGIRRQTSTGASAQPSRASGGGSSAG